jgi:hypothetical protein
MNNVLAFLAGGIFTLATVLATAWLIVRHYDGALTSAHTTIAELHNRLLDPESQAKFDKYMTEQRAIVDAQLKHNEAMQATFGPIQAVPDNPTLVDDYIAPVDSTGNDSVSGRGMNDLI